MSSTCQQTRDEALAIQWTLFTVRAHLGINLVTTGRCLSTELSYSRSYKLVGHLSLGSALELRRPCVRPYVEYTDRMSTDLPLLQRAVSSHPTVRTRSHLCRPPEAPLFRFGAAQLPGRAEPPPEGNRLCLASQNI